MMSDPVKRAVETIKAVPWQLRTTLGMAQALAEAGLLLTDEDRAVLEAAEAAVRAFDDDAAHYPTSREQLVALGDIIAAVRARREAQS